MDIHDLLNGCVWDDSKRRKHMVKGHVLATVVALCWVWSQSQHGSSWLAPHLRLLLDSATEFNEADSWIHCIGSRYISQSLARILLLPVRPHLVYKAMVHLEE